MLDTFMHIDPMKILLDRGLSQAGVFDRRLSHATWATCWSDGSFWTCRHPTRDSAILHPCRQAAYFLPCTRPPDAAHKLLARGLKTCLGFKDDSTASCTDYIASINTNVSQLGHMPNLSICDVFTLVTLMGLYLSDASGHQKAYKELLVHVDAGNTLTLDDVHHVIIQYSRSKSNRAFAVRQGDVRCTQACPR